MIPNYVSYPFCEKGFQMIKELYVVKVLRLRLALYQNIIPINGMNIKALPYRTDASQNAYKHNAGLDVVLGTPVPKVIEMLHPPQFTSPPPTSRGVRREGDT